MWWLGQWRAFRRSIPTFRKQSCHPAVICQTRPSPLDAVDQREMDDILAGMRDLFRVFPPWRQGGEE
jgi:hypothetical protein